VAPGSLPAGFEPTAPLHPREARYRTALRSDELVSTGLAPVSPNESPASPTEGLPDRQVHPCHALPAPRIGLTSAMFNSSEQSYARSERAIDGRGERQRASSKLERHLPRIWGERV